jgi:hypothetical protein
LKKGDKVYLVRPTLTIDMTGRIPEFMIEAREIERASDKQIKLKTYFTGGMNVLFAPSALGKEFYATPREALAAFRAAQVFRITDAERRLERTRREAADAIEWVDKTTRDDLCGFCGRECWMHGTRHDTCVSFVEPTDVTS